MTAPSSEAAKRGDKRERGSELPDSAAERAEQKAARLREIRKAAAKQAAEHERALNAVRQAEARDVEAIEAAHAAEHARREAAILAGFYGAAVPIATAHDGVSRDNVRALGALWLASCERVRHELGVELDPLHIMLAFADREVTRLPRAVNQFGDPRGWWMYGLADHAAAVARAADGSDVVLLAAVNALDLAVARAAEGTSGEISGDCRERFAVMHRGACARSRSIALERFETELRERTLKQQAAQNHRHNQLIERARRGEDCTDEGMAPGWAESIRNTLGAVKGAVDRAFGSE